jgi:hypothetical protein
MKAVQLASAVGEVQKMISGLASAWITDRISVITIITHRLQFWLGFGRQIANLRVFRVLDFKNPNHPQ